MTNCKILPGCMSYHTHHKHCYHSTPTFSMEKLLLDHIENTDIHVTKQDKERWDNMSGGGSGCDCDLSEIKKMIQDLQRDTDNKILLVEKKIPDITYIQQQIDSKVGEAPFDGNKYVRKNGQWVVADEKDDNDQYEIVTVNLSSSDNQMQFPMRIFVYKDGNHNDGQYKTTDSNGRVMFSVKKNTVYTIEFEKVEGYKQLSSITNTATQSQREINLTYVASTITYNELSITKFLYNTTSGVPASGGTYTPTVEYHQYKYTDGAKPQTITSGATITYRLESPMSGVTLQSNGTLKFNPNTSTESRSVKVFVDVAMNGQIVTQHVIVMQAGKQEDVVEYKNYTASIFYTNEEISHAGALIHNELRYSIDKWINGQYYQTIRSGATVTYSSSANFVIVYPDSGIIKVDQNTGEARNFTVSATIILEGHEKTVTTNVMTQKAAPRNPVITYGEWETITKNARIDVWFDPTSVEAEGGVVNVHVGRYYVTYDRRDIFTDGELTGEETTPEVEHTNVAVSGQVSISTSLGNGWAGLMPEGYHDIYIVENTGPAREIEVTVQTQEGDHITKILTQKGTEVTAAPALYGGINFDFTIDELINIATNNDNLIQLIINKIDEDPSIATEVERVVEHTTHEGDFSNQIYRVNLSDSMSACAFFLLPTEQYPNKGMYHCNTALSIDEEITEGMISINGVEKLINGVIYKVYAYLDNAAGTVIEYAFAMKSK